MEYLIVALVAGYIGWRANNALNTMVQAEIFKELGITEKQLIDIARKKGMKIEEDEEADSEECKVNAKIEQHQGVLYCFRKDDDKFLGQGCTRDELIERVRELYKGQGDVTIVVTPEDGADLIRS